MPLTLVTGPANAAKAGAVLDRFRRALARDPLLVVPTRADVEHYQRELAADGVVFGGEVVTFSRLARLIAERAGASRRILGPVARERVVRAAIADAGLRRLAPSAGTPGFAGAVLDLVADLERALVPPERFSAALAEWEREEPAAARAARAEEVGALYAAYRRRLDELGAADPDLAAWLALDALRARPSSWARRPVFFYGFGNLTGLERDAVETLSRIAEADVVVALPYEPGRAAFAAAAATVAELAPLADGGHEHLPDRADHYAPAARPALHHLERHLFEPDPPRREPNGALRLLEAGGERAEAELVAAEVLELLRQGLEAPDIAVLARGGGDAGILVARALEEAGVPVTYPRQLPLAATRLGAGLLAAARVALGRGTAGDVLTWLRTPGRLPTPALADAVERAVLRAEATTADEARRLVLRLPGVARPGAVPAGDAARDAAPDRPPPASDGAAPPELAEPAPPPFDALDTLAAAAEAGAVPFLEALVVEADAIWTAPHRRRAAVLGPAESVDAAVVAELRHAVRELRSLGDLAGGAADAIDALGGLRVRAPAPEGGVLIADPFSVRARRFRAVAVCGLQEGEWPRTPPPDPFLDDDARRSLARATRLALPRREDTLGRERALLYACVSRPEQVLLLSWRSSDEEGNPAAASPFLEDVRACFTDTLWERRGRRLLADVTWTPKDAPTPRELRRALIVARAPVDDPPPLSAPATPAVLEHLAARDREPARGLETFAACGVRWLVDQLLRPRPLDPDPEPMRHGLVRHAVLERTLELLAERTGSGRLSPDRLPDALAALDVAMAESAGRGGPAARRAGMRRLHADLVRYLEEECEHGAAMAPELLEWRFGDPRDGEDALDLGDGLRVTGRVDRIDVDGAGGAIVRDYKGASVTPGARWATDGSLQAGLYALAVRERLGLEPLAALYQPLTGPDLRPRGLVRKGTPGRYVNGDAVDSATFEATLEQLRESAREAARALRAGEVAACPGRCSTRGCAYPGICRAGEPAAEEEEAA